MKRCQILRRRLQARSPDDCRLGPASDEARAGPGTGGVSPPLCRRLARAKRRRLAVFRRARGPFSVCLMITAHSLTKRYGSATAVDNLTFEVPAGVVTGFLGPNGSGKSTTMRMIMGLDYPDSGVGPDRRQALCRAGLAPAPGRRTARRQGVPPRPHRPQPPALAGPHQRHPAPPGR